MKPTQTPEELGHKVASEAIEHIVKRAEDYCECERQRLEATNQPEITARLAELSLLHDREQELKEQARLAPPAGDLRSRRCQGVYFWAITLFLTVAGFFFSVLALEPYQLGWKSYLYCLGIAVVSPFCVEQFLQSWGNQKLIRILSAIAAVAALASLMLLALIRGDLLVEQFKDVSPVVMFEDPSPATPQPQGNFYDATLIELRLLMALLALAIEIGAGLALHNAWRFSAPSERDPDEIERQLARVQEEMVSHVRRVSLLQNEPAVFVAGFWRDFYRAMLNGTARNGLTRLSVLFLCLFAFGQVRAVAAEPVSLIVALDLTQSVAVRGYDGKAAFEKNLAVVPRLLSQLPSGSRITVLGITDNSFGDPYILLTARLSEDVGYFKERLAAARHRTVNVWQRRARELEPRFPHTDVFGALVLAGQMLKQEATRRKIIIILSDLRHDAYGINLEHPAVVGASGVLGRVIREGLVAELEGVEVYALGVHAAGKRITYWRSLRQFWTAYFERSGATLKTFSVTRDLPEFGEGRER